VLVAGAEGPVAAPQVRQVGVAEGGAPLRRLPGGAPAPADHDGVRVLCPVVVERPAHGVETVLTHRTGRREGGDARRRVEDCHAGASAPTVGVVVGDCDADVVAVRVGPGGVVVLVLVGGAEGPVAAPQ